MASKTFIKQAKMHILKCTPVVNDYICATLWELGEATSNSFFSPKYAFTKPTRILFGLEDGYEKRQITKNAISKNLERLIAQGIVKEKNKKFTLSDDAMKLFKGIGIRKKILGKKWDNKYRLVISFSQKVNH